MILDHLSERADNLLLGDIEIFVFLFLSGRVYVLK